jgi:acetyltransferase-like isoleucine patch superfamily enzyme
MSVVTAGRFVDGDLPSNVRLGDDTLLTGGHSFRRFQSVVEPVALEIGARCTMDGVQFALGPEGIVSTGDCCYFTNAVVLCELEIRFGSYVMIGWNTTIADTDFHPIAPAERIDDAIAISPASDGRSRPPIERRPVVIEDDVHIGPNATILKGVTIGAGSFIEAGALVTADVPPRSRVLGNPARIVGTV